MSNSQAISEFFSAWQKFESGDAQHTGQFTIYCRVFFQSDKVSEVDDTFVTIYLSGPDKGQVQIQETNDLNSKVMPLSFTGSDQHYVFDSDSDSMIVEAFAGEMGGDYSVRLHPRPEDF